jgi:proline dehydrogenase
MALLDRAIVRLLPAVPKPVIRSVSSRYITGSDLADATATVRELNAGGKLATVDILGEETTSETETYEIARAYEELLAEIDRRHLDSNISIKPTALGLELDFATCKRNIRRLVHRARVRGNFVRIDMEDATTTTATLALYRELREEGFDETGVVLQASLKRTLSDIDDLADLVPNVRICKGIYVESPDIQFRDFHAVQRSFVSALEALLDAGCYVGIATHDEWLLEQAQRIVAERSLGRDEYEFQMLLGVRPELGDRLVADGHRLRIYVPFGSHWYEYSIRRLKENPSVAGYIASDTMGRVLHLNRNGGWVD